MPQELRREYRRKLMDSQTLSALIIFGGMAFIIALMSYLAARKEK